MPSHKQDQYYPQPEFLRPTDEKLRRPIFMHFIFELFNNYVSI